MDVRSSGHLYTAPDGHDASAGSGDETRVLRDRQRALDSTIDLMGAERRRHGAKRVLVSIANLGSMPASNDHFFAAHPVELNGAETEGGSGTPVIDTSTVLYVDVIGSVVPSAGDLLTAVSVGGRWVAERGGVQQSNCCTLKCSPCSIPRKNLQLDYTNVLLIGGTGTTTLYYSGASWTSDCVNGLTFTLDCNGGQLELRVISYTTGSCPDGTQQSCSNLLASPHTLTLASYECEPFSLTFNAQSSGCPTVAHLGYTQFVVSDPSPVTSPPGLMCLSAVVELCNGDAYAGATVTVYTSEGGTEVASCITNASGVCYVWWQGAPGSYYVTVDAPGWPSSAATINLACSGGSIIAKLEVPNQFDCCNGCSIPPLTLTDKNGSWPLHEAVPPDGSYYTDILGAPGSLTMQNIVGTGCAPGPVAINASGNARYQYQVTCTAPNKFVVNRFWSEGCYTVGSSCPGYTEYDDCTGAFTCAHSAAYWDLAEQITAFSACGAAGYSQGTLIYACYPFSASGSLAQMSDGFAHLDDPVGGTVAIEPT
jgi:hypothetical protein